MLLAAAEEAELSVAEAEAAFAVVNTLMLASAPILLALKVTDTNAWVSANAVKHLGT